MPLLKHRHPLDSQKLCEVRRSQRSSRIDSQPSRAVKAGPSAQPNLRSTTHKAYYVIWAAHIATFVAVGDWCWQICMIRQSPLMSSIRPNSSSNARTFLMTFCDCINNTEQVEFDSTLQDLQGKDRIMAGNMRREVPVERCGRYDEAQPYDKTVWSLLYEEQVSRLERERNSSCKQQLSSKGHDGLTTDFEEGIPREATHNTDSAVKGMSKHSHQTMTEKRGLVSS